MKIIHTDQVEPKSLRPWERSQVYNGLDACVTTEVLEVLLPQLSEHTSATYAFSRALQGPVLEMRLRGVKIDLARRQQVIGEFESRITKLEGQLYRLVADGVGFHGFNWRSYKDLQELFYDYLKIPVIRKWGRPTTDRNAREKMEAYLIARPFISHINRIADLGKKISVLQTEIDPDGRIRTSYNIAGTNTGRFSSSLSEFGTGGNLQNVEESLRSIFIADKGMKLAKFDAKQGESYCVGATEWNLFKDGRYLDACETGDIHTATTRQCWPNLPWTGDLNRDKALAEEPYYRGHSRRFMAKKIGHGSNYAGQPSTLAQQAKVEVWPVEEFQIKYFRAYPAHLRWHAWVETQIKQKGWLVNLTGRKRWFFGRRDDQETLRKAIAYDPQGSLADIVNHGMLNVFHQRTAALYMHDHDAITVQYPEEKEDEIVPRILEQLRYEVPLAHGRSLTIPYDCKVGWNKGDWSKENPNGLKDYVPSDKRHREKEVGLLDRPVYRTHGRLGFG